MSNRLRNMISDQSATSRNVRINDSNTNHLISALFKAVCVVMASLGLEHVMQTYGNDTDIRI